GHGTKNEWDICVPGVVRSRADRAPEALRHGLGHAARLGHGLRATVRQTRAAGQMNRVLTLPGHVMAGEYQDREEASSARSTKSRRSCPQKGSPLTTYHGAPNTLAAIACWVQSA